MSEFVHTINEKLKEKKSEEQVHHSIAELENKLQSNKIEKSEIEEVFEFKSKNELSHMTHKEFKKSLEDLDNYYKNSKDTLIKKLKKRPDLALELPSEKEHILDNLNDLKNPSLKADLRPEKTKNLIQEPYRIKSPRELVKLSVAEFNTEMELMEQHYEIKQKKMVVKLEERKVQLQKEWETRQKEYKEAAAHYEKKQEKKKEVYLEFLRNEEHKKLDAKKYFEKALKLKTELDNYAKKIYEIKLEMRTLDGADIYLDSELIAMKSSNTDPVAKSNELTRFISEKEDINLKIDKELQLQEISLHKTRSEYEEELQLNYATLRNSQVNTRVFKQLEEHLSLILLKLGALPYTYL